ncbi:oxidoreductase [Actinotalea sp.]|uniref:oxidoreductase n=1 Tax=Actinotalea sp. TaxID=1872145 RepID=UPI0035642823
MRLFGRRRDETEAGEPRPGAATRRATEEYLAEFVRTRVGVEAYIEPATRVTQTTVVLIATTGEWTRRKVPDPRTARQIARDLSIPVYDVQLTGYPQRMRDWTSRQTRAGR